MQRMDAAAEAFFRENVEARRFKEEVSAMLQERREQRRRRGKRVHEMPETIVTAAFHQRRVGRQARNSHVPRMHDQPLGKEGRVDVREMQEDTAQVALSTVDECEEHEQCKKL